MWTNEVIFSEGDLCDRDNYEQLLTDYCLGDFTDRLSHVRNMITRLTGEKCRLEHITGIPGNHDLLGYPRIEYSLAHSEFLLQDTPLKEGDTMDVCLYDYKSDTFQWIPVVFHCSYDYDDFYFSFEGLPFGMSADGLHVRNYMPNFNHKD